ncbi:hypothetical protein K491DRAFT_149187 [Lophiostoma macrostomum CBS 122681]|uniref:Uncharacterized protein n=1 Tax=Lophiostoma macrostomum CBS 122681 TaxID=1314788 RepID=A0A6A6SUK9_9PLEO|nr:hypothetical protein K491DRAFT_149187 [Lophiostoma macrostomum CBS 122681]
MRPSSPPQPQVSRLSTPRNESRLTSTPTTQQPSHLFFNAIPTDISLNMSSSNEESVASAARTEKDLGQRGTPKSLVKELQAIYDRAKNQQKAVDAQLQTFVKSLGPRTSLNGHFQDFNKVLIDVTAFSADLEKAQFRLAALKLSWGVSPQLEKVERIITLKHAKLEQDMTGLEALCKSIDIRNAKLEAVELQKDANGAQASQEASLDTDAERIASVIASVSEDAENHQLPFDTANYNTDTLISTGEAKDAAAEQARVQGNLTALPVLAEEQDNNTSVMHHKLESEENHSGAEKDPQIEELEQRLIKVNEEQVREIKQLRMTADERERELNDQLASAGNNLMDVEQKNVEIERDRTDLREQVKQLTALLDAADRKTQDVERERNTYRDQVEKQGHDLASAAKHSRTLERKCDSLHEMIAKVETQAKESELLNADLRCQLRDSEEKVAASEKRASENNHERSKAEMLLQKEKNRFNTSAIEHARREQAAQAKAREDENRITELEIQLQDDRHKFAQQLAETNVTIQSQARQLQTIQSDLESEKVLSDDRKEKLDITSSELASKVAELHRVQNILKIEVAHREAAEQVAREAQREASNLKEEIILHKDTIEQTTSSLTRQANDLSTVKDNLHTRENMYNNLSVQYFGDLDKKDIDLKKLGEHLKSMTQQWNAECEEHLTTLAKLEEARNQSSTLRTKSITFDSLVLNTADSQKMRQLHRTATMDMGTSTADLYLSSPASSLRESVSSSNEDSDSSPASTSYASSIGTIEEHRVISSLEEGNTLSHNEPKHNMIQVAEVENETVDEGYSSFHELSEEPTSLG